MKMVLVGALALEKAVCVLCMCIACYLLHQVCMCLYVVDSLLIVHTFVHPVHTLCVRCVCMYACVCGVCVCVCTCVGL